MQTFNALAFALLTVLACSKSKVDPATSPAPSTRQVDASPDPARRLTRVECTEGVDHAIALFDAEPAMADAAKQMRDGRDGFIRQCEATATVRDHECLMASTTSHELGLCPMPGSH